MAAIRGKDTRPELLIRRGLHALGLRYRLHARDLPGKPDLVFPKWHAVVFVHGCFWHGHDCPLFRWPATREDFWRAKIEANRKRDDAALQDLEALGWRHAVVWECALKGRGRQPFPAVIDSLSAWISSDTKRFCIKGTFSDGPASSTS